MCLRLLPPGEGEGEEEGTKSGNDAVSRNGFNLLERVAYNLEFTN